ncbi:MAG TPA: winged helix-turn-helix domain-containing protein [Pseudonocardiaceae bacterium]|nr:winged helix-turn-helix domain-containing protein [Pseudonocardiaceae bacterium]
MAYRIHFTAQDLARTRVAQTVLPLTELDLAARALQSRDQPVRLDAWRHRTRAQLPTMARMALALIPRVGFSLAGPAEHGQPEELLAHVRTMSRTRIRTEVGFIAQTTELASWAHQLADDSALFQQLVDGLADLYDVLVRPYETQLADVYAADREVRGHQFLTGGVESLLSQVNPTWMRWNPPVLEIRKELDYDLHLAGQGVLLAPSMFSTRSMVGYAEGWQQPIVTYPARHGRPLRRLTTLAPDRGTDAGSAISALLGRTRAAVLTAIAEVPGCSTTEIAKAVGIAPASASEHATVLRRAGLISTARHRNSAVHTPTDLAITLLDR